MALKRKVATKWDVKGKPIEFREEEIPEEEIEERQKAGQEFIREREKLTVQLMERGITPRLAREEAGLIISKETEKAELPGKRKELLELARKRIGEEIPEISELEEKEKLKEQEEFEERRKKGKIALGLKGEKISTPEEMKLAQKEIGLGVTPVVKTFVAEVWDTLNTAISRKEPLKVQNAVESFNFGSDIIRKDIELVKTGDKDYISAIRDFENAVLSIQRLESSTKLLGKENMNWWIDDGMSIQVKIEQEKRLLELLREDLIDAAAQARVAGIMGKEIETEE